jgi:hypothetical protein
MSNPFAGVIFTIRGWHPAVIDPGLLEQALINIGKTQSGSRLDRLHAFLVYPPTVIQVLPSSPLHREALKRVFNESLRVCKAQGIDQICREMRDNWCRPWDRARVQLHLDQMIKVADQLPPDAKDVDRIDALRACLEGSETKKPMDAADFEEWWALVTSEDHVAVELTEMCDAWTGAIEQAPGLPSIDVNSLVIRGSFKEDAWKVLRALAALFEVRLGGRSKYDPRTKTSYLDLSGTAVRDEHLPDLVKVRFMFPGLHLDVRDTAITDSGLGFLRGLSTLVQLSLKGARVTETGIRKLRKALPEAEIIGP